MCHRLLKFVKHEECGHLAFLGDSMIDCRSKACFLSTAHTPDCNGVSNKPCNCRRYYGQPERLITHHVAGKCPNCPQ